MLIGEAVPAAFELEIPSPPSFAQALAAKAHSPALDPHIENVVSGGLVFHPVFFCCGADVPKGVGLRVFAAPVAGFEGVAAAWQADAAFHDDAEFCQPLWFGRPWIVPVSSLTWLTIFVPVCWAA